MKDSGANQLKILKHNAELISQKLTTSLKVLVVKFRVNILIEDFLSCASFLDFNSHSVSVTHLVSGF